jgi:hypothetical protein
MSKDKGGKNKKKAPNPEGHKPPTDFQASKTGASKIESTPPSPKKK